MLRLSNVSSGYGSRLILKKINLVVQPEEILAIIGLNGSGKSTLVRTMLGLLPTIEGDILIDERNIKSFKAHERAQRISLLDSKVQIHFPISVAELLKLGALRNPHDTSALRHEALEAVGLAGYEKRNTLELSSGETKRALIAHTLCSGSKIILLDEPLTNLDWSHQADLVENLKTWQKKFSTTFVVAVHELDWAVKWAHRMAVVHEGQIFSLGSPSDVLVRPDVREVFAFNSRIDENPFDGSQQLILTRAKKESEHPHGYKK